MRRKLWKRITLGLALAGCAVAAIPAIDLAALAVAWGPAYAWRVVFWREPAPGDGTRFPARGFPASTDPVHFITEPGGTNIVRAAFGTVAPPQARPDETLEQFAARTRTTSLLVLRGGRLLYEGYFNGHRRDTPQTSFSMAKSVTSLLVGAAVADGLIPSVDMQAEDALPQVPGLRGSGLTLRNLLDMTSGFALNDAAPLGPLSTPWTDYKLMYFAPDLRRVASAVRVAHPPGTHFFYDDRNPMLLGMLLERVTHEHVATWLGQRLWQRIGAEYPANWNLDRRGGFEKMESGINARPIDFLKLGDLVLRGGRNAAGAQVLPAAWVRMSTAPTPKVIGSPAGNRFYGMLWWGFTRGDQAPDVFAEGVFGEVLYISRADDTVILRTGNGTAGVDWPELLHRLADALASAAPRRGA